MAASSESGRLDDMIVQLMSMGFDIQDCQDAIHYGKVTVEAAVEWLVAGKPGFSRGASGPSLKLRSTQSNFGEGANPFVSPLPVVEPQSANEKKSHDASNPAGQSEATGPSQSESMEEGDESGVVSRLHLSEQQRKVKNKFEQKEREQARKEAQLEKQKQKEAHARILKEIAEDREKQKLTHQAVSPSKTLKTDGAADVKEATKEAVGSATAPSTAGSQATTALIQVRLPGGRAIRKKFSASAPLKEVWNYVSTEHRNIGGMGLIQPFPHHEFTREEMNSSLSDLGLTPSGSLVLQRKQNEQATDMDTSELKKEEEMEGHGPAPLPHGPSQHHPHFLPQQPQPHHNWGQGHLMEEDPQEENAVNEEDESGNEEQEEGEMLQPPPELQGLDMPWGGHQMGGAHVGMGMGGGGGMGLGDFMMGGGGGGHHNMHVFGGVGQRLVPEGHPSHQDTHHSRSAREIAVEKAQARLAEPKRETQQDAAPCTSASQHNVSPLLQCCLQHICPRLNDPRNKILYLTGISEDLAQKLLTYLIKEKLLKPKTLNAFVPCYLRTLVLDCYPYTTNELLHAVRLHSNLNNVSLCSCPLITDAGLQSLAALKKLKTLNVSCCQQLTNKCLPVISACDSLVSLNLESTGVTDDGVLQLPQHLQHLNLNRTAVTHKIIPCLQCMTELRSLYLEGTKFQSLSGLEVLHKLETLNVAHTLIVPECLLCLQNHSSLTTLSIADTENLNGDSALRLITSLRLQCLTLPSRHTTTDVGIQYLSGLPLTVLDLTNYINVGSPGMEHIGQIRTLKKLLLSNTKVTDEGLLFLEGLTKLEVLYLDRTAITDQGMSILLGFNNLLELSMASTGVTSEFLVTGLLNQCKCLAKLNLSRTGVTNRGVKSLELPCLHMLSLDGNSVSENVQDMIPGCPVLTQVSLRNLLPYDPADDQAVPMDT